MWFPILARLPFALAGIVTGWFVAEGTVRYDVVQLGVSLVMLAVFLACGIYAPAILRALGFVRRRRR
ncbi:hypothetical protein C241_14858 [Bradyrhizobium lupini HPC(L)]|uniref:Uncharacterized protein n=1 Tax=Bradyrhizobium lupini HPC(L) TaxID=1229491 RepID=A0ABN0HK97_RHILU|nr:hypothetical protein C241_14858 [Bradyrhizobium lupini HPC(L)]